MSAPATAESTAKDELFAHIAAQYAGFFGTWLMNAGRRAGLFEALRDRGMIHYEWLVNLEQLVGKGEFQFTGYPLKLKGGTGSPVRAVAEFAES